MIAAAGMLGLVAALVGCAPAESAADTAPRPERSTTAPAPASPEPTVDPAPAEPVAAPLGEGVEPAAIRIAAIDLDEPLIDLGIKSDGSMYVPAEWNDVGWFTGGGRPGGRGPTVIAGHVDSVSEPAVFYRLAELVPGDTVEVTDVNGAVTTYAVSEVTDFPKAQFPTGRVFGALPTDELRLITCGGFFDPSAASYVDNTVVFAVRV
ncbi:class F sortase [Amnibacterium flavum]|uniref:Class F sortase n=1 Tax=Amnibacterium flavum TaxID=2173173 RepID=A0A2V1HLK7_9MICO|nr:class F sortase [Amnibacterium flavum]PVZ93503.1 class F sortase [Amnibacterium flavum]